MCLAAPSLVVELGDGCAVVESFGQRREVSLLFLEPGSVALGDYLLVQAGGFAYERLDAVAAQEALQSMQALMQHAEEGLRTWGKAL